MSVYYFNSVRNMLDNIKNAQKLAFKTKEKPWALLTTLAFKRLVIKEVSLRTGRRRVVALMLATLMPSGGPLVPNK